MNNARLIFHNFRSQKVIVIDTARAVTIENAAIAVLSREANDKRWLEYSEETLLDQQELYLAELMTFDDVPIESMSDQSSEYFFNLCVYLAVFRRLLQAKRRFDGPPEFKLVE